MNPYMQVPGRRPGKFRVGQTVRVLQGFRGQIGEVIEYHGPIGVGGSRLYSVRLRLDPWNDFISHLDEESIEAVEDGPQPAGKEPNG